MRKGADVLSKPWALPLPGRQSVLLSPSPCIRAHLCCPTAQADTNAVQQAQKPCVAGTGKTLVARALAATASKAGRPVAFFMRKGADVLSKWVGEAERQLRLLFAEAKRCQPAIIFFDEIDGLAPVS